MKALTLRQPWATLIAQDHKNYETRRWHPRRNPGVLAIASSKTRISGGTLALCNTPPFAAVLPFDGERGVVDAPTGMILAVARVTEFLPTEQIGPDDLEREGHFGDFTAGRWAWFMPDVIPLHRPIAIPSAKPGEKKTMRLGLWDVPKALITPELTEAVLKVSAR